MKTSPVSRPSRRWQFFVACGTLAVLALALGVSGGGAQAPAPPVPAPGPAPEPSKPPAPKVPVEVGGADNKPEVNKPATLKGPVEVRFTDNSTLKLTLLDEKVEFMTPYGKLTVPMSDIQQLDFASRVPEDAVKKIEKAIADLGNADFKTRETATTDLLAQGVKAYPLLVEAAKSGDTEVRRRAESIVEKIKQNVPPEMLKVRKHDVVTTDSCKFTGQIAGGTLKAQTLQFGDVQLRLSDVLSIKTGPVKPKQVAVNAQPDPGSLTNFGNQLGQSFFFTVTGAANGSVWGTDVYTTDSSLAMAAVHVGAVEMGKSGVVKVTIVIPPPNFTGTTRNGVTTSNWGPYPSAYTVSKPDAE